MTRKNSAEQYDERGPVRELAVFQALNEAGADRPKRIRSEEDVSKQVEKELEEVRLMTLAMQEHAESIKRLARKRRTKILQLREKRVTYRLIADAMGGATIQAVYKVIRGDL